MKKIGLLTLPLKDNYGGILQAIALYSYLERIGFEPWLIKKEFYYPAWKKLLIVILGWAPFQNIKKFRSVRVNKSRHKTFVRDMIRRQTESVMTNKELIALSRDYEFDAVVVGSDQVWRIDYIDKRYYGAYFLDFLIGKKVKKVAYAASFGLDQWQALDKVDEIKYWLSYFDAVSVRESSGLSLCRMFGRPDAMHVLDPTLLIGREFYDAMIDDLPRNNQENILYYVLDENNFSESLLNDVIMFYKDSGNSVQRIYQKGNEFQTYSIPEWLKAFAEAKFVLTDSFHGMVFSVLFNKPFIAIANKNRGASRFESFLQRLDLHDRLVAEQETQQITMLAQQPIDYEAVNLKLRKWQAESSAFLQDALRV